MSPRPAPRPATVMLDAKAREHLNLALLAYYNKHNLPASLALAELLNGADIDVYTTTEKARAFHNKVRVK